jgi:serine/threonine-protein kinase
VAERYRVEALLGRGAMGAVYRVQHVFMRKRFALKVLEGDWAMTPGASARFEREAIASGNIDDPHIAHATDFGRLEDGSCFLVLEYLDGRTLRSALGRGALDPDRALAIARGVVAAVEAAHAAGVIHRDLKPENIMLVSRDGDPDFVKVLDFGIAILDPSGAAAGSQPVLTLRGAFMGTPYYMAPEQVLGELTDARSDLYAVGVILFEMLTGDCPFQGEPASVFRQHVMQEAPPLPPAVLACVGEPVAEIVRRLLAKQADERFQSAHEVGVALDRRRAKPVVARAAAVEAETVPLATLPKRAGPSLQAWRLACTQAAASLSSWWEVARSRLQARRNRARLRATLRWSINLITGSGAWTKIRRRTSGPSAQLRLTGERLRKWSLQRFATVKPRHLAWVVAAGLVLLVLALAWPSATDESPHRSTARPHPARAVHP